MCVSKAFSPKHASLGPENSYVFKNRKSSFLGVPLPELWVSGADKLWSSHRLSELLPPLLVKRSVEDSTRSREQASLSCTKRGRRGKTNTVQWRGLVPGSWCLYQADLGAVASETESTRSPGQYGHVPPAPRISLHWSLLGTKTLWEIPRQSGVFIFKQLQLPS